MKRILFLLLLAVLTLPTIPGTATADTLDDVKKRGALTAGVLEIAPPFGFKDPATGNLAGIDVEVVRAVAKKLGVEARLVPLPVAQRIPSLVDRKVDLVAGAMTVNYDRARLVDFSKGYFRTNLRVLARKGAFGKVEDLSGRKVGVVRGSTPALVLADDFPAVVAVPFAGYRLLLEALKRGEVDAMAGEGYILRGFLPDAGEGYEIATSFRLSEETVALAVHKGEGNLLAAVNEALSTLKKEGEIERIFNRFLQRRAPESLASPRESPAVAVVTRRAGTGGRYLAVPVRGVFTEGAPVSFYTPQGKAVGKGAVMGVYDEAIYVDGPPANLGLGFLVGMNLTEEGAKEFARTGGEAVAGVKESVKREDAAIQAEISAQVRKEEEERMRWQEDMTKTKMYYDYEYDTNYYYHQPWW